MFSKNNEEVPLKKKLAYRVDLCFSVCPYAKLLALLLATILLFGFGGLALYSVSDGTLSEALWLSWTFVADFGKSCRQGQYRSKDYFSLVQFWRYADICNNAWACLRCNLRESRFSEEREE